MQRRKPVYVHEGAERVPVQSYKTNHPELRQELWTALQAKPRITVETVEELTEMLPPAGARRLVKEALKAYSGEPADRSADLRSWFKGKLHSKYPMNDRVARALTHFLYTTAATLTERERHFARGFPDPKGLAIDFVTLVGSRVTRQRPIDTSAMFSRNAGRRQY